MCARSWRPVELRLVGEWAATRHGGKRTFQRVRVGGVHPDLAIPGLSSSEQRMLGVWRRWVDALVVDDRRLLVIEAAVMPDPGDVSQLELYLHLVPLTPELVEFRTWPMQGVLVYAIDDPVIRRLARDRRFLVEIFRPPWVDEYLGTLYPRKRQATLTALPSE